jgi:glutaredoxin
MILESKNVEYQVIDITEPGKEAEKEFMQLNGVAKDSKYPLPPQIFSEEDYCGVIALFFKPPCLLPCSTLLCTTLL